MIRVVAGVYIKEDEVYICQRPKEGNLANYWEFPGGKVEKGEDDCTALIREMNEECNAVVAVHDHIDTTIYHYESFSVELVCYYIDVLNGELKSIVHQDEKMEKIRNIDKINFAPADLNTVRKIQDKFQKNTTAVN